MQTTAFLEMNVYWELHSSLRTTQLFMVLPHQKGERELLKLQRLQRDPENLRSPGNHGEPGTSLVPRFLRSAEKKKKDRLRNQPEHSGKRELGQELMVKLYSINGTKRATTGSNRATKPNLSNCLRGANTSLAGIVLDTCKSVAVSDP